MATKPDVLIVDGYNIIGDWPHLRAIKLINLEEARTKLLDDLADYRAFYDRQVIVVFDAHESKGQETRDRKRGIEIIFTREKETADERIELLAGQLRKRSQKIIVATSDSVEQGLAFGSGALRLSARELLLELHACRKEIHKKVTEIPSNRNTFDSRMSEEMSKALERWRRE